MRFTIMDITPVPRDTLIEFGLDITNPLKTPRASDNFWRCTHFGPVPAFGGLRPIKSSKAFQSWTIIPQLEAVEVILLGPLTAAESISKIRVAFTAVSSASDMAIEILTPPGFSFATAVVEAPEQQVFVRDGSLIRVRTPISPGARITVNIAGVRLGRQGGQTDVQITTWKGGLYQDGVWNPGQKQDERLRFTSGFRLPGRVLVPFSRLFNDYDEDPLTYPVQSSWLPQMSRPAYAEFRFQLERIAEVGTSLVISAPPYEPTMRRFSLRQRPSAGASGGTAQRSVAAQVVSVSGNALEAKLGERLVTSEIYEVVMSVIAPQPVAVQAHGIPIQWTIKTTDAPPPQLPVNTNDGVTDEFGIVEQLAFEVQVQHAPPTADVIVTIRFDPGLTVATELRVVSPRLFNFSANCLVAGGGVVTSCSPGQTLTNGRAVAVLALAGTGLRAPPADLRIRVQTPSATPDPKTWFVQARDVLREKQLGWGEAVGFDIQQMADTTVVYPGVSTVSARMIWRFRIKRLVAAGGWLHMALPAGMSPQCQGSAFQIIALPAASNCRVADSQTVLITLNSTMVPGEYAFGIMVTPPVTTPVRNLVSLLLKDRHGNVQDGSINMPGVLVREKLKIAALPLHWTSSRPGRSSIITIGFKCLEPLPDLVVAPVQQVAEILVTLPTGFTHLVERVNDFTLVNEGMPLRAGDWLDYMQKDRLRITLNLNRTSWMTLTSGDYWFRFAVSVPNPLPVFNVWFLSLCSPNYPAGCSRISDQSVMINFAMPGFQSGQAAASSGPGGLGKIAGAFAPSYNSAVFLLALGINSILLLN